MKVQIGQLVATAEPLSKLMSQPMPSATAFRCSKILKLVQSELENYETVRKGLVEKYGKDGEVKQKSKNWSKFLDELNDLLNTEVKLDTEKIKESNLSKVEISPSDIMALAWLIEQ